MAQTYHSAYVSDAEIEDLKRRTSCARVAQDLGAQLRARGAQGMIGSCPKCGGGARSTRFKVTADDMWMCAPCVAGGDVIRLVQHVRGMSFLHAVEFLGGTRVMSRDERDLLETQRREAEAQRRIRDEAHRLKELNAALAIWNRGRHCGETGPVRRYLSGRGCGLPYSARLREVSEQHYYEGTETNGKGEKVPRRVHCGPAMVAAFFNNKGQQDGVHITWLEVHGRGTAQERVVKLQKAHPDDGQALLVAKKMRGGKKGRHIVLRETPQITRLFIAEGIETGLAVATAFQRAGKLQKGDAFWAAGDLGNLGGPAVASVPHSSLKNPKGMPLKVPGPEPDWAGEAIAIPASVKVLVLLGDGDSDRETVDHALARGRKRYARPGLVIATPVAAAGMDFNDMLEAMLADEAPKAKEIAA